jgi:KaiC/GvpD/RAD55 family RecA-like ATPase
MAFITNINLQNTRHEAMLFDGRWRDSFGCPSPCGAWLIYGTSGSGKTGFALQLAKYLTQFDKVLYWSIEQGNSPSFKQAWMREGLDECGNDIMLADEDNSFDGIVRQLTQKRGRNILFIDSLTPLRAKSYSEAKYEYFGIRQYESFRKRLKGKLIVWIGHEQATRPDTKVGDYILKLADLKMRVEGWKVFTNTRSGKSLQDFVIWEQGATGYWGK